MLERWVQLRKAFSPISLPPVIVTVFKAGLLTARQAIAGITAFSIGQPLKAYSPTSVTPSDRVTLVRPVQL